MSSSQQMIRVPREWLSAYLENDAAMVYFDGERTSLWELLSNAVRAVQPDEQLQRESIDSPIDFLREENFLKLESEIERKEQVIVRLRVQLSERSDPCNWSDQQVLEFLGVALRNVDLVGEIRLSEIRQGFEHMRPTPSSSERSLENCGDEPQYRWPEELHTKVSQSQRSVAERDERAAFEAHYAAEFSKARSPEYPVTAEDVKGMRDGDSYGDRYYLNGQWVGWQARAALERKP